MEMGEVQAFIAVVESRSVQMAAARLNLSQSAVTRRLQNLERSLGCVHIHRDARPLVLTPEGVQAYKHAKNVISAMDTMRSAMLPDAAMEGEFRLGISMSLGDTMLAEPIECIRREFPRLRIHAAIDESQALMKKVERRELDGAVILLTEGVRVPDGLSGELLDRKPLGVVVPKTLSIRLPVQLGDLLHHPWALNPAGCTARDELVRVSSKLGKPLHILMESSSAELKYALIQKNLCIGLVRVSNVSTSKYADKLRVIVPTDFKRRLGMWLVFAHNPGRLHAPLARVRDTLRIASGQN